MQEPAQASEAMETVICILGLVVGLVGIVIGSVLTVRALHLSRAPQGPL